MVDTSTVGHPSPSEEARRISKLAICSLVFAFVWLAGIGSIIAVVAGHVARARIREKPAALRGKGLAMAGLVLGYAGLVLAVLSVTIFLWRLQRI
jgi:hypothetical protein